MSKMGRKQVGKVSQWVPLRVQSDSCCSVSEDADVLTPLETQDENLSIINVSNPEVSIPDGIFYRKGIVSEAEEIKLIEEILERDFIWEGFDQRRRVQRYTLDKANCEQNQQSFILDHYKTDNSIPKSLLDLHERLATITGFRASHVAVEEYAAEKWYRNGEYASNHTVTTFETSSNCLHAEGEEEDNCWFVAQIPIRSGATQHFNQPLKRHANCWTLKSPNHWTDILMEQRSLLIKSGDCLHHWRNRVTALPVEGSDDRIPSQWSSVPDLDVTTLILKFYRLPEDKKLSNEFTTNEDDDEVDNYGYIPSENDQIPPLDSTMPDLKNLLTLVITTSPVRSNPSTELLEKAIATLNYGGPEFAYHCRKIIICDGCRLKDDNDKADVNGHRKVTTKHTNVKQAMRNGIVTSEQAEKYKRYKDNLKSLCTKADENSTNNPSPFQNTVIVELEERHGYGYALRHALQHCVDTQFVCVIQHDRTLMRPTPILQTVNAMWRNPGIKYVGMSMRTNLLYRDLFIGKYGRSYLKDFDEAILRVPELIVDASKFGPNSESSMEMARDDDKLLLNINSLVETYRASAQSEIPLVSSKDGDSSIESNHLDEGKHQLILTPTLFWYDNVHICDTAHYRDFIFNPSYKMVARGGFVEDKLSPVMKRTVERLGFKDGHSRFGSFLLDDSSGMFFSGHLDGGSYLTSTAKEELRVLNIENSIK